MKPQKYTASFHIKSNKDRSQVKIKAAIRSNQGKTWALGEVQTQPSNKDYQEHTVTLDNSATAPDAKNVFTLTFDASEHSGRSYYFGLVSLFPETFAQRPNGLRKDIAEAFYDMKPKFLRFPGGNNLEGESIEKRWKWYETIGPLKDRPGRPGNWGY